MKIKDVLFDISTQFIAVAATVMICVILLFSKPEKEPEEDDQPC